MATIVDLAERAEQRARDRESARLQHPSLRWVAVEAFYVAHRKDGSKAACGAQGALTLAPPGVPRCVTCYPPSDTSDQRDTA